MAKSGNVLRLNSPAKKRAANYGTPKYVCVPVLSKS